MSRLRQAACLITVGRLALVVFALALLGSARADAAYALVSHAICGGNSGGVTAGCSLSGSGGDLIVIEVAYCPPAACGNAGTAVPTDSSSNSYSQCGSTVNGAGASLKTFYKQAPSVSGSMTFSLSEANSYAALAVSVWSGSAVSPCDQSAASATTGTTTTWQPGSITPSQDNELVVTGFSDGTTTTYSVASATLLDTRDLVGGTAYGIAHGYVIQTMAAAVNPTWTFGSTGAGNVVVGIASFKAAAAGGASQCSLALLGVGKC